MFGPAVYLLAAGSPPVEPRIAIGADGTAVAIWVNYDGPNEAVQAATRTPGGSFGPPANLSPADQDVAGAHIAIAPDGTATAIWRRDNGTGEYEIQVATQPAGGNFGSETTLSVPGENGASSRIVVAPDGTATAVWFHVSEPTTIIRSATRLPGGSFSAPEDLTSAMAFAHSPRAAVAPDGTVTVIWQYFADLSWKVQATTRPPGGSFGPDVDLSVPGPGDYFPQVAIGPDGRATAVWVKNTSPGKIIQAISTEPVSYRLDVARGGTGNGTVTSSPDGIDCGPGCSGDFDSLTRVTLTAAPDAGSLFTGWRGACSERSTCEVTMTEAAAATAVFATNCSRATLRLKHPRKQRNRGTASLTARAGLAGRVILRESKKVKRYSKKIGAGGKARLKVRARGKVAKRLRRRGRLRVKVRVLYRPAGGCSKKTRSRMVTLIRRR